MRILFTLMSFGAIAGLMVAGMSHVPMMMQTASISLGAGLDIHGLNEALQAAAFLKQAGLFMMVGAAALPVLALVCAWGAILGGFGQQDEVTSIPELEGGDATPGDGGSGVER
jgi:hypothetical protein